MQVYLIQNTVNGRCYVGQHSGVDLGRYLRKNLLEAFRGSTVKRFLYNAFRKYGAENFTIRCIHKCADKDEMDRAEKAYIKLFGTRDPELGYNLTDGGGGLLGVKRSEETKAKMRKAALGNGRCIGRVMTDATRNKIRKANTGNKYCVGNKHSEETKQRMREAWLRRKAAING